MRRSRPLTVAPAPAPGPAAAVDAALLVPLCPESVGELLPAQEQAWVRSETDVADCRLVAQARTGDDRALAELLVRYRPFARARARAYFLMGGDHDDVVQEGMIGLYKAIRDFDVERQGSFRAFAELCVTRQIITAVKTATRQKHGPLNSYISLNRPVGADDDGDRTVADLLPGTSVTDPAEVLCGAERLRALQRHVDDVLSELETEVLRLYVEGKSYVEIADLLHRQVKSIDNALQRIKRKLEEHLRGRSLADAG